VTNENDGAVLAIERAPGCGNIFREGGKRVLDDGDAIAALRQLVIDAAPARTASTLTPLLKRLEAAELVRRLRNPNNERQVVVSLTPQGKALKSKAGCLGDAMLTASGQTPEALGKLNEDVRRLRDAIYASIGGWNLSEQ
jgi:hypothetical protein